MIDEMLVMSIFSGNLFFNIVISNINNENTTLEQSLFKKLKPIFNYRKIK